MMARAGSATKQQTEQDIFWYEHLSAQQLASKEELVRSLKKQGLPTDNELLLLRFLRARHWDVVKAEAMLKEMLKWRQDNNIDAMLETFEYPEIGQVLKEYPHFYHKTDKWGRPVYIELLGELNMQKFAKVTTAEKFIQYHIFCWERFEKERLPACSRAAGRTIATTIVILDLAGLTIAQFTANARKVLQAIAQIDQDYYAEHLGTMLIINAPIIFRGIWAVVRPWLDERTAKKIQVLGTDYHSQIKALIPEENLLTRFGGKSVLTDYAVEVGPWNAPAPEKLRDAAPAQEQVLISLSATALPVTA